jgi:hypothetical protein
MSARYTYAFVIPTEVEESLDGDTHSAITIATFSDVSTPLDMTKTSICEANRRASHRDR